MSYQTIRYPDGTLIPGMFPTLEWFSAIAEHVDFENRSLLDVGCSMFSYGLQALDAGASLVTGIEINEETVERVNKLLRLHHVQNAEILHSSAEAFQSTRNYDVVLFSMVIHWLKDPEKHIKRLAEAATDKVVFVFRNPDPPEPGWFEPSFSKLDSIVGGQCISQKLLMDQDKQYISLAIYDKNIR